MRVELGIARERLLFRRPFGTAHGLRDGTDAVFLRSRWEGHTGYGESTLPPYIGVSRDTVIEQLSQPDIEATVSSWLHSFPKPLADLGPMLSAPARAALVMAVHDLLARRSGIAVSKLLGADTMHRPPAMATIGIGPVEEIPARLAEMPAAQVLKVKLGGDQDRETLRLIAGLDSRPLFLDANQGWNSVAQAMMVLGEVPRHRILGLEQPFPKDRPELARELALASGLVIYADESMQDELELIREARNFGGVNIKLMKCGGLDRAMDMIACARAHGLQVMLGCMSESSLGCAAMAQLQGLADLVDLDGPWLLANDPFQGLTMDRDGLHIEDSQGHGVDLARDLSFGPIGA